MILSQELKTEIYEQYSKKVTGYIYSRVNDGYLAEDLCADVFLKVYEKLDSFDETKASLSTWIFTITRNTLIDYYRIRRVNNEIPEDMAADDSIEEEVCNNETVEILTKALSKLAERERDIIILHYYKKETLRVIAEKMKISYPYVKILHNKALENLRKTCDFL